VERADALDRRDQAALAALGECLVAARRDGDAQPPFAVIATYLSELGIVLPEQSARSVSLERARDDWLARLRSAQRSRSTLSGYRVALDDLLGFLDRTDRRRSAFCEETLVAYLVDYRRRAHPAEATYYRRFVLLRRFFRWLSRRSGVPDPFLDLEPPAKPLQSADWLTPQEFTRLLDAAGSPRRRRPGLAERDQLVLLALVATGLRRAELLALNWGDLDLDSERPSLLVRRGKGGKARRQPLIPALAHALARRRDALAGDRAEPVFCGLAGRRLTTSVLATIVRRAAERAGLQKHVTPHTLRHTAATWLRQATGDARLVAEYLGHADLSTVSRYTHIATTELHDAAEAMATRAGLKPGSSVEASRHGGAAGEQGRGRCRDRVGDEARARGGAHAARHPQGGRPSRHR
jgi:integrase/recombinase XerD